MSKNTESQARFHICYDKAITMKDFEDVINLVRVSNNELLHQHGVSKPKANEMQKIDKVLPGSIEIVLDFSKILETVANIETIANIATIGGFIINAVEIIKRKINERRERERTPREDKKVYDKNAVYITIVEQNTVEIYINNGADARDTIEHKQ